MFDLISIGDTVVDTLVPLTEAEVLEKNGLKLLGLPYGAKLAVEQSISLVGGNACNNAVGSARLGLKTAIYTNVGNKDDDEWDHRILAKLKKEKVDTRFVLETNDLPSNHNIILSFKGERTILVHHQNWEFKLPDLDKTRWIYLTSMSPSFINFGIIKEICNYLKRSGAKLAYQPGTFQLKEGIKKNAEVLVLTEVFIINLEEGKTFLGYHMQDQVDIKKLLSKLADLGPKIVVITDGINGSFAYDGINYYQIKAFPSSLKEMTGAGDAYATGLVAGFFYGKGLTEAMRFGAANGASVVEEIGPQAGLLTYDQMQQKLLEHKKIVAKEI